MDFSGLKLNCEKKQLSENTRENAPVLKGLSFLCTAAVLTIPQETNAHCELRLKFMLTKITDDHRWKTKSIRAICKTT